jgi:hypothetical protein
VYTHDVNLLLNFNKINRNFEFIEPGCWEVLTEAILWDRAAGRFSLLK